jgi:hypothetical protein
MKNYLLFRGYTYYPSGGWQDFIEDFDCVEDTLTALVSRQRLSRRRDHYPPGSWQRNDGPLYEYEWDFQWYQVVDLQSGQCVASLSDAGVLVGTPVCTDANLYHNTHPNQFIETSYYDPRKSLWK